MITFKEHDGNCWICGSIADSQEHRHKKTDIKREFVGTSPKGERVGLLSKDNSTFEIQGPDSKRLKFKHVICQNCNNNFSKPFDLAYVKFINYILENVDELMKNRKINFLSIFHQNTIEQIRNLYKYYLKHLGCRLSENNIEVSIPLVDFINGKTDVLNDLLLRFEVNYDLYILLKKLKKEDFMYSNLYKGSMKYTYNPERKNEIEFLFTFYTNEWFRVYFIYSDLLKQDKILWLKKYYCETEIPIDISWINDPEDINRLSIDELIDAMTNSKKENEESSKSLIELIDEKMKNPYLINNE